MPKQREKPPVGAIPLTKYAELQEVVAAFGKGRINLLVIHGSPGLSKSQILAKAIEGTPASHIKGARVSGIGLYEELYNFQNCPIILDDIDLTDKALRQLVKSLTETDATKIIEWKTRAKLDIPKRFTTTSSTCIITNTWGEDALYSAIESRAELFTFCPDWRECYEYAATWLGDQEILDYLHDRLGDMRAPDLRILVKARQRKEARLRLSNWRAAIDAHIDDQVGLHVRRLLDDESFATNDARAKRFVETTGKDRATFYRRMKQIKNYRPPDKGRKINLARLPQRIQKIAVKPILP